MNKRIAFSGSSYFFQKLSASGQGNAFWRKHRYFDIIQFRMEIQVNFKFFLLRKVSFIRFPKFLLSGLLFCGKLRTDEETAGGETRAEEG